MNLDKLARKYILSSRLDFSKKVKPMGYWEAYDLLCREMSSPTQKEIEELMHACNEYMQQLCLLNEVLLNVQKHFVKPSLAP